MLCAKLHCKVEDLTHLGAALDRYSQYSCWSVGRCWRIGLTKEGTCSLLREVSNACVFAWCIVTSCCLRKPA